MDWGDRETDRDRERGIREDDYEYDFTACNNARHILHNTNVLTSVAKFIVHSPVSKLISYEWTGVVVVLFCFLFLLLG